MEAERIDIYEACDKAIHQLNREILRDFGRLKAMDLDAISLIREIKALYRRLRKRARQKYYEIGFEAYLLGMAMCDVPPEKAHRKAEKRITGDWADRILEEVDFVTLYRFNTETERKAERLAEALEEAENLDAEIDRAMRLWSQQVGQYAINVTDYAIVEAFTDAGVQYAEWITVPDERRCSECHALHGQIFRIDEVPRKPHLGCRCRLVPVFRMAEDAAREGAEA